LSESNFGENGRYLCKGEIILSYYDLIICIRCHAHVDLIIDTIDSVLSNTDSKTTLLMVAIDGNNVELGRRLSTVLPGAVYVSTSHWGWGAGLYGLLAESIVWANKRWTYGHFMSIDYDTLFIKPEVDYAALDQITDSKVGLIGHYNAKNIHWATVYSAEQEQIVKRLGYPPRSYTPGEGVQGGCFIMTNTMLKTMKARGMLGDPYLHAKGITRIADDHLITMFTRMCGLQIKQISADFHIRWTLDVNPLMLNETPVKVFHPTKIRSNGARAVEVQVRNHYRALRGREPLR